MEESFKYHIPEDIPANERTAFHGAAAAAAPSYRVSVWVGGEDDVVGEDDCHATEVANLVGLRAACRVPVDDIIRIEAELPTEVGVYRTVDTDAKLWRLGEQTAMVQTFVLGPHMRCISTCS